MAFSNGRNFTTKDKDLDTHGGNCARWYTPFWHSACTQTTPNGYYKKTGSYMYKARLGKYGITWTKYKGTWNISMKAFRMMIRRLD